MAVDWFSIIMENEKEKNIVKKMKKEFGDKKIQEIKLLVKEGF